MHRSWLMPALENLMKRFGFVKLARHGLVLTPEGRIMSLRPAILDDGLGGRIVGWPEDDLAAMELQKWEPARPASKPAVATRLAVSPPPIPLPKPPPRVASVVAAPVVAQAPQVDEDEWEWEIALARARAAAEESEQAAASVRTRARLDTIPPPAAKLPVVTIPPVAIDYEDRTIPANQIMRAKPALPVERPQATPVGVRKLPVATIPPKEAAPVVAPRTIIPVPKLPSIKDRTSQIQPVVRPSRTRLAKGTGPVIGVPPPPPIRAGEDEEKTIPGLPPSAAAVSLPSIKRLTR
jgi:hypothetical protein